jgi:hypothetical protein
LFVCAFTQSLRLTLDHERRTYGFREVHGRPEAQGRIEIIETARHVVVAHGLKKSSHEGAPTVQKNERVFGASPDLTLKNHRSTRFRND